MAPAIDTEARPQPVNLGLPDWGCPSGSCAALEGLVEGCHGSSLGTARLLPHCPYPDPAEMRQVASMSRHVRTGTVPGRGDGAPPRRTVPGRDGATDKIYLGRPGSGLDDQLQLDGTVSGGTVVLGTVTGPPPPTGPVAPDVEAGLPAPSVRWSRTSRVPLFAVVTKPPILGLAMSHSEKGIEMSASTSISLPTRSAEQEKVTAFVTPCMARCADRAVPRDDPERGNSPEDDGGRQCQGGSGVLAHIHDGAFEPRVALALVAHDARHVDGNVPFVTVAPAIVREPQILLVRPTAVALLAEQHLLHPVARNRTGADVPCAVEHEDVDDVADPAAAARGRRRCLREYELRRGGALDEVDVHVGPQEGHREGHHGDADGPQR